MQTVSIDFGTSHSGYAWASKELGSQNMQPGQVMSFLNAKQTWPDATGGTFYPKTRTCLIYDTTTSRVTAWGNTAAKKALDLVAADMATTLYIDRVKLLLDEKWADSEAGKNLLARLGKTPSQAIAEYLVALADVLAADLEAQDGRLVLPQFSHPCESVIDHEKNTTVRSTSTSCDGCSRCRPCGRRARNR
ncbi:hypothetical protein BC828DRAFT_387646 [Blastocladiella britannica]|nr:hypothetical protein BC828DRAFT_387646 [Blastocladiella britannica]